MTDGTGDEGKTAKQIVSLLLTETSHGVAVNRMPGGEAVMLSAWLRSGRDVQKVKDTSPHIVKTLQQNTGFYSEPSRFLEVLDTWCHIYLEALRNSTLLYRLEYATHDHLVQGHLDEIHIWSATRLHQWLPYLHGKRVLICNPFTESIQKQIDRGHLSELFVKGHNAFVYPQFSGIELVKSHNTILGNDPYPQDSWLESLEDMYSDIMSRTFDIAILGCGGYGVPLCEMLRKAGKHAFYAGSYCQVMFGVKGRRWENPGNPIGTYFNEHWRNPLPSEVPNSYLEVEGGCYW